MRDWLRKNLEQIYGGISSTLLDASNDIALSPSQWNPTIWGFVNDLTQTAIIPIATTVLIFSFGWEIYNLAVDKNRQHDIEFTDIMFLVFKLAIMLFVTKNVFPILLGIFDIAAFAIGKAASIVSIDASGNLANIDQIMEQMETLSGGEYFSIWMMSCFADNIMVIFKILVTIIIYGRMIEIYLYCSIAAIPAAAVTSKEIDISKNFFKTLCALGLQGFLIMFCLGVYGVLANSFIVSDDVSASMTQMLILTGVLMYTLFKTSGIAKSIMNSH